MPAQLDYEPNEKFRRRLRGPNTISVWAIAGFFLLLMFTLYVAVFGW